ncbi:MAG TPA: enolase C-terminal domain-like protein [Vicinamibacterales bacterium]|nr:enolase C-terminal domain-like protein [Vicinamibacterales bacterium]
MISAGPPIGNLSVSVFIVPTDAPEADGTFEWTSTTIIVVEVTAGGTTGIGYSYADAAAAMLISTTLASAVRGIDALSTNVAWTAMNRALRNTGRPGVGSAAIAAVDAALWDAKGRILSASVADMLGLARDHVPVYGSGGFTSYSPAQLHSQLSSWVAGGIGRVKMKIGRDAAADVQRVEAAREAIGPGAELFVDANGGYTRKQALAQAERFAAQRVTWFEEPVSSDDLAGLALIVDRAPAGMDIAAGEYGYDLFYFRRMLEARAVDVLQADATRCGGITGFMKVAALAESHGIPLSAHTAPSIHVHPGAAIGGLQHIEYFHDHVRIEHLLFDGAATAESGVLRPDRSRPGLGLALKRGDADRYRKD